MTLYTSLLTAGTNSHAESSENANAVATDLLSPGVHGVITNTSGVAPTTGDFGVNAQASPNMTVAVNSGVAYVTATPSSQNSQNLRVRNTASANVSISANSSGSTKYDYVYVSVDATKAANPASDASDAATLVVSRSSSNTTDNGTPPTYGTLLAIVTVANGASSITNGNITDMRVRSVAVGGINDTNGNEIIKASATTSAVNEITVANAATGNSPQIAASGNDTNIHLSLTGKGTGGVLTKNPYKFSAYRNSAWSTPSNAQGLVTFDTTYFDTGSNYSTSTGKFTAPIAGFYFFTANVDLASALTGPYITFYVNGVEKQRGYPTNASSFGTSVSGLLQLSASDYVQVYIFTPSSVSGSTGAQFVYFQGFLVSAT